MENVRVDSVAETMRGDGIAYGSCVDIACGSCGSVACGSADSAIETEDSLNPTDSLEGES